MDLGKFLLLKRGAPLSSILALLVGCILIQEVKSIFIERNAELCPTPDQSPCAPNQDQS